jgi:hypothetical protein
MKKLLLSASLIVAVCFSAFSQAVPNGNFENWTPMTYDILQFYPNQNANIQSLQYIGQQVTTKVNDSFHGSFAVRVETKTNGVDTTAGYFINGSPNPSSPKGGIPYSQQPTGMTGHYKCNVPSGDSAIMLVMFKKNGLAMPGGMFIKKFSGVQSSYATFNWNFSLSSAPDTVIFGSASSDIAGGGNFKGIPGSFLQLDSINFKGVVSQPVNMNGSFELWNTGTFYNPNGWKSKGDSINRSTASYTNTYAAALQVVNYGDYMESDQITTGYFKQNAGTKGGYPYTLQNDSLVGYYKLTANGNDTALINVAAMKTGSAVGGYSKVLLGNSSYQRFSIPLNFSTSPDTLRIDIMAGKWPMLPAYAGSKLWVDALQLLSQPLAVPVLFMGENYISTYPNPSNGMFHLVYDSESTTAVKLEVYNEVGQLVHKENIQSNGFKNTIDLRAFNKGLYLLKTEQNGVSSTKRILIQ